MRVLPLVLAMWIAASGALAQPVAGMALRELLQQARSLAESRQTKEALALLESAEDEFIGLPEFDYELGRAALAAGRPDRATLAFTRVLARQPNHAGALIDMGRAFAALGNLEQARAQFGAVLALGPPPDIRAQVERELRTLAPRGAARRVLATGFVRLTAGSDDNVNQSASQSQIFIPLFGQSFALDARNVRMRDSFSSVSVGFELTSMPDQGWGWTAAADAAERRNGDRTEFNTGGIGGRAGILWRGDRDLVRVQAVASRNYLDGRASRELAGLSGEWLVGERSTRQWLLSALHGRLRHPAPGTGVFDADLSVSGLTRIWLAEGGRSVALGAFAGFENAVAAHPSGDKRFAGLRAAAMLPVSGEWRVEAAVSAQRSNYNRTDAAFLAIRSDRRVDTDLALRWQGADGWSVRGAVAWNRQGSNIPIYAYTRQEYSISLQKDFK